MKVQVKLFAIARDLAGVSEVPLEVDVGATVADVRAAIERARPELKSILPYARWAVDMVFAGDAVPVTPDSQIAVIPPVSGG